MAARRKAATLNQVINGGLAFGLPTAIGLVLADSFRLACLIWFICLPLGIAAYLRSDWMKNKHREIERLIKRKSSQLPIKKRAYFRWRTAGFLFGTILWLVAIYWTHNSKQNYVRNDVLESLDINYSIPNGEQQKPENTKIAVKNRGKFEISARHQIQCLINLEVDPTGRGGIRAIKLAQSPEGYWMMGGPSSQFKIPISVPIAPGGDGQTDSCLKGIHNVGEMRCADITIEFVYYLEDQPDEEQRKKVRLIAEKIGDSFTWGQEPVALPVSPCEKYVEGNQL